MCIREDGLINKFKKKKIEMLCLNERKINEVQILDLCSF